MLRIYDFQCPNCEDIKEVIVNVDENERPTCKNCSVDMLRLPHTFGINMGVGPYGYYDENLGPINTNAEKRERMREMEVTPKGDTPKTGQAWV